MSGAICMEGRNDGILNLIGIGECRMVTVHGGVSEQSENAGVVIQLT
jgi:hypothetical protein